MLNVQEAKSSEWEEEEAELWEAESQHWIGYIRADWPAGNNLDSDLPYEHEFFYLKTSMIVFQSKYTAFVYCNCFSNASTKPLFWPAYTERMLTYREKIHHQICCILQIK